MLIYNGNISLSWLGATDGSVTQGSLCSAMTQPARVRGSPGFYFFHIFLELEFYNFRNYDQIDPFRPFSILPNVFLYV